MCCFSLQPQNEAQRQVICGGEDSCIYVYDFDSHGLVHKLSKHRSAVSCVDVSPDGTMLVSADYDGCVCLWKISQPAAP